MRLNFIYESFVIGITLGEMWLEYLAERKERFYGLSLYLGIIVWRIGVFKEISE